MPHGHSIPGGKITSTGRRTVKSPCVRCGMMRSTDGGGRSRTGLCRECRSTMTKDEIELWREDKHG